MKTILITGASSGIGKAAVFIFAKAGWNVAATMRNPKKENDFKSFSNIKLYPLDVTDNGSIQKAFKSIQKDFGQIDVVVNNAGYGLTGIVEAMSDKEIEQQFNTNVFGLMRVTREAIKIMRKQKHGTIIQISSVGGRVTLPLYSMYHATKWAIEGFTESLHYELLPFNIKLKIIEPGVIKTDFYGRSKQTVKPANIQDYDDFIQKVEKVAMDAREKGAEPSKVAKTILRAATDNSNKLRYPVAYPAPILLWLRKRIPDSWFFKIIKTTYKI